MAKLPVLDPSMWLQQIFEAKAVAKGGVVRRSLASVQKHASLAELIYEVELRGFHLVQTGGQLVVICNPGQLTVHC